MNHRRRSAARSVLVLAVAVTTGLVGMPAATGGTAGSAADPDVSSEPIVEGDGGVAEDVVAPAEDVVAPAEDVVAPAEDDGGPFGDGDAIGGTARIAVTRDGPERAAVRATTTELEASAPSVRFGDPVTFSGKVTAGSAPLADRYVTLERRPVGGTWRDWTEVTTTRTDGDGEYSFRRTPGTSGEYRARIGSTPTHASSFSRAATVIVTGKLTPGGARVTETTLEATSPMPTSGEAVWFSGKVAWGTTGISGRTVTIERRSIGGSTWTTVARGRTGSSGTYSISHRPTGTYEYRARVGSTSTYTSSSSGAVLVSLARGGRTLEARAEVLGRFAGAPEGQVTTFTSGSTTVRYRSYSRALLVEVGGSTPRTWAVHGAILDKYLAEGGPRGRLGPPVADAKCVLLESGCVQRFRHGAIYDNANVAPTVGYADGRASELIATALSQVGYAAPSSNISKYNRWIGTSNAWCSIFQSWVSEASGNPGLLPTRGNFRDFHASMRTRTRLPGPRVGAIAFFDTHLNDGRTAATHAGLVIEVRGSTIVTVEGNTANPATGTGRGVYVKYRPASLPLYYYMPNY